MEMKYYINKEKRVVVCVGEHCERDAFNKIVGNNEYLNLAVKWTCATYGKDIWMKDRFVGKAYCAEDDEWNEEIGKSLAKERMLNAYVQSKAKKMREITSVFYNAAADFRETTANYKYKVNKVVGYPLFNNG